MADARRRWDEEEIEKLINLIETNYEFLFAPVHPAKTKSMIEEKWQSMMPLSVSQIKKKWADLKSNSKHAVAKYRRESNRTGQGSGGITQPTDRQQRIAGFIGAVHTQGVPGSDLLFTI